MTAVEWLEEQMFNLQIELNKEKISITKYEWIRLEIINQAKEMEKEQMLNAYEGGETVQFENAEQYYNQTFKSE